MNRIERSVVSEIEEQASVCIPGRIYSFKEAKSVLGVSAPTLRQYLRLGLLSGKKLGRKWFIAADAIKDALELGR